MSELRKHMLFALAHMYVHSDSTGKIATIFIEIGSIVWVEICGMRQLCKWNEVGLTISQKIYI